VDTGVLVQDLADELRQQERGRSIEWEIGQPLPHLWADPLLLQVAVRNLLSNAVKYTRGREPARIRVAPAQLGDGEGLEISDNGVGFSMRYAPKLFGVFQRLHRSEEFDGTGIGLANVKRIVERHGGQVWARGEPGRGASFGFVLPPRRSEGGEASGPSQEQESP
jgi:chemotaxis family two-component system sensor kinase Cph1